MGNSKLEVRVAKIEVGMKTVLDTLTKMDARMEGLDHVIRGNGRPGLVADTATISLRVGELETSRNRWRDLFFTIAGCVVGGFTLYLLQQTWSVHHEPPNMSQVHQVSRNH